MMQHTGLVAHALTNTRIAIAAIFSYATFGQFRRYCASKLSRGSRA
jgi:hypothetical protein